MSGGEIEARFRVVLYGKEELDGWLQKTEASIRQFEHNSTAVNKSLKQTGDEIVRFGATAARTMASISGLNFGIAAQARSVLEFRDSINRLATAANLAEDKIGGLKDQVLDISVATGQMKESVTDALGAFVAKTGDIETARKNLELYARTATATGASLKDVAEIGAQLSQKMGIKNQSAAMGILASQGDIGAIEMKDLASKGPALFAAAASAGYTGMAGVRSAGALAQLFAEGVGGTGSAARVVTSVENVFASINKKQGDIEDLGIPVGDRDPISIAEDIVKHFKGNVRAISASKLFTAAGMRGIQTMALGYNDENGVHHAGYNESGKFEELEKFKNVGSEGIIDLKFGRNSKSGLWSLAQSQAKMDRSTDKNLGDLTENLARQSGMAASAYDWATANPRTVLAGAAGGLLLKNLITNFANEGATPLKGQGRMSGLLGGGGGASPVRVTNWPAGGGGLGGLGAAAQDATQKLSVFKLAAQNASTLLATFGAAYAAGRYIDEKTGASDSLADAAYEQSGQAGQDRIRYGRGVNKNRLENSLKEGLKKQLTMNLMKDEGLSFGQALYKAEHMNTARQENLVEMKPTINITIADGKAEVDSDGTRHPEVKVRRGGAR